MRAAHEAGVQHAGQHDVVDEAPAAGEQHRIFEARDAGAEMLRAHGSDVPGTMHTAARRMIIAQSGALPDTRGRLVRHRYTESDCMCNRRRSYADGGKRRPIDARRRKIARIRIANRRTAARFPGASRRARSARTIAAHRAPDQQGHRAASAGALAVPGRAAARISGAHSCSPMWSMRAAARYDIPVAVGALAASAANLFRGHGPCGRGDRGGLAARNRKSDCAGRGVVAGMPGGRDPRR